MKQNSQPIITAASYWMKQVFRRTLISLPRHQRALILPEPFWSIPFGLFTAYASLYQEEIGLTPLQIGLVSSVGLGAYALSSLFGGFVADKIGRKRALLVFNLLSWSLATFVWAISQNLWFFVLAAVLNGLSGVAEISFGCLLVEDSEPAQRLIIFSWLQVIDLLSGLIVPVAGLLVGVYGIVTGARLLYWFGFVSMTSMFLVRNRFLRESSVGLARIEATRDRPVSDVFRQVPEVVAFLMSDARILATFVVSVVARTRWSVMGVYLALFLTRWIGLEPPVVAMFPTVSSFSMLLVTLALIPLLRSSHPARCLALGFMGLALGVAVIALSPAGEGLVAMPLIGMAIVGSSSGIVNPYLSTIWHNLLPDERRAQTLSVTQVIRMLFTAPSGYVAGILFGLSPVYPLYALFVLCVLASVCLMPMIRGQR